MVIKTWSQPIHDHQEGEVSRERTYLEQFFIFPGSLHKYSEFIDYVFKKLHGQKCNKNVPEYENILNKYYNNSFEFDPYDINKGQAPSYGQLKRWANGVNCNADIKYTWKEIRTSFRNEIFQNNKEDVKLIVANSLVELTQTTLYLNRENKSIVEKEKRNNKFTSNKSESANKANKANVDTLLSLQGDDSTIKADVNLNAAIDGKVDATVKQQMSAETKATKLIELKEKMKEMNYD